MALNFKFFILFFLLAVVSSAQEVANPVVDSIVDYLLKAESNTLDAFETKLDFALRAKKLSETYKIDSLRIKSNRVLSSLYGSKKDNRLFLRYNHKALKLAKEIQDSLALAQISKDLGYYYYNKSTDSAYYYDIKAEKLFKALGDNFNTAVILLDIALLQKNDKDYTGSELTCVKALSLLDQLEETETVKKYKSYFYNNLGLVFKELGQFEESIEYNLKALEVKDELQGDNRATIDNQKNNLANAYNHSEQFDKADYYYQQILKNENLIHERPDFYAVVLDNYAFNLFLSGDYSQLPHLFLEALHISDSIGKTFNTIVINQHLAEYYHKKKRPDSAKYYAYRAKELSEPNYTDYLLESLLILSKVEVDSIAVKHYDAYVTLYDSIIKNERTIRNKFARIQFETDKIEQENIEIARERTWLFIISVVVVIASLLLYMVIIQRNKNRELQFVQKQQEANEEIYNLMLSQNETIEEARTLEKKRISQELHDGVLGRLFGTRLSLDSLNMNNSPEAVKTRSQYIEGLKAIEEDIRKVSHELNTDFVSGSGFIDIIKTLVETQTLAYGLEYNLVHDDAINWDNMSNRGKIHIYRIIQEILHNIYKHAQATQVSIRFKLKKNVICLIVADNGSGFDVNKSKSGIGLKNMKARVNEIEGHINIKSEINKGTTVTIEAPFQ
ncbi:sensor histidine kinase [Tamlana fucoidanivorans]|uniref:Tetratricopeptide repeat protein n=1 Tax=Allotamlana fucoidanivorans TaxID=2583814 RepID=A0A5C4SME6_9FLAO|nr:sensor histidine kinase [Tamlana fucoidanivorans]TNJ45256.1 tetratricopeptide repeat protein [Tamlana fucoidanivorans]